MIHPWPEGQGGCMSRELDFKARSCVSRLRAATRTGGSGMARDDVDHLIERHGLSKKRGDIRQNAADHAADGGDHDDRNAGHRRISQHTFSELGALHTREHDVEDQHPRAQAAQHQIPGLEPARRADDFVALPSETVGEDRLGVGIVFDDEDGVR